MGGDAAMRRMIGQLRELGSMTADVAPAVADVVRDKLEQQVARGTDPDGKAWQPTQKGEQPLQHAGKAIGVTSIGPRVIAVVHGVEARHHKGIARGGIVRQILPSVSIPRTWVPDMTTALTDHFRGVMGGGS